LASALPLALNFAFGTGLPLDLHRLVYLVVRGQDAVYPGIILIELIELNRIGAILIDDLKPTANLFRRNLDGPTAQLPE
jgi:hypothetical protein